MADLFTTVNTLSILLGGRRPEWIRQIDSVYPNGAPVASSGVPLRDAPRTQILVDLREQARLRTSRIAVRVLDLTATYRVTIDLNPVDFDAAAAAATSLQDVINGWRDAINADGTVNAIVTASSEDADGDGLVDTLLIQGDTEADYSISAQIALGGTAELDVLADPTTANILVWLSEKPPIAGGVASPGGAGFVGALGSGDFRNPNGAVYSADIRGFAEFLDTAGYDRLYVELTSVVGVTNDAALTPHTFTLTPRITVGPAILE